MEADGNGSDGCFDNGVIEFPILAADPMFNFNEALYTR